ncbi:hypothetical protein ICN33_10355, partial [Polynucleobacter sp. UB-Tiil-W10]|nr:hypothetical protein [Polynucleobacter sp. UB-Tiil-W10]
GHTRDDYKAGDGYVNGYDHEGYNHDGKDRESYGRDGKDDYGHTRDDYRAGDGYVNGYDHEGYNHDGKDRESYGRDGKDDYGHTRDDYKAGDGYVNGYDHEGYNHDGKDRESYGRDGKDDYGHTRDDYRAGDGYVNGYDHEGYNHDGKDRESYGRDGKDDYGHTRDDYKAGDGYVNGYDHEGYNHDGKDRESYGRDGKDDYGHTRDDYKDTGYAKDGYDHEGYDRYNLDKRGNFRDDYKNGYDNKGYDHDGYDHDGKDQFGHTKSEYKLTGYVNGYDHEGYNQDGFDKNGYNRDGLDKAGHENTHAVTVSLQHQNTIVDDGDLKYTLNVHTGSSVSSDLLHSVYAKVLIETDIGQTHTETYKYVSLGASSSNEGGVTVSGAGADKHITFTALSVDEAHGETVTIKVESLVHLKSGDSADVMTGGNFEDLTVAKNASLYSAFQVDKMDGADQVHVVSDGNVSDEIKSWGDLHKAVNSSDHTYSYTVTHDMEQSGYQLHFSDNFNFSENDALKGTIYIDANGTSHSEFTLGHGDGKLQQYNVATIDSQSIDGKHVDATAMDLMSQQSNNGGSKVSWTDALEINTGGNGLVSDSAQTGDNHWVYSVQNGHATPASGDSHTLNITADAGKIASVEIHSADGKQVFTVDHVDKIHWS